MNCVKLNCFSAASRLPVVWIEEWWYMARHAVGGALSTNTLISEAFIKDVS